MYVRERERQIASVYVTWKNKITDTIYMFLYVFLEREIADYVRER